VTKPPGVDLTSDSLVHSLQKAYDTALADYNDKHEKAQCELNGTCGTNIAGEGAASEAAKAAETTAKQAMDDAKAKLDAAIADATAAQKGAGSQEREVAENALPEAKAQLAQRQAELKKAQEAAVAAQQAGAQAAHVTAEKELAVLRPELERIQDQKREDERIFQDTLSSSGGLLNRLEALERLGNTHSAMRTAEILLSLLFIFIEILPVVMKVMMNLGTPFTYDKVLATRNEKLKESLEAADNVEVEKAARDAEFALERHEDLIAQERESAHLVNEQVVAVQREVIQQAVVLWREKALEQAGAALNRYSADPVRVEDRVVVGPEPEHTVEEEPDSFSPSSPYAQERESRLV
jgi:hypothetical protein